MIWGLWLKDLWQEKGFGFILLFIPRLGDGFELLFRVVASSENESECRVCASYRCSRRGLMRLKVLIALSLMVAPALAFARPTTSGAHMRPQVVRNRVPKARVHEVGPHR